MRIGTVARWENNSFTQRYSPPKSYPYITASSFTVQADTIVHLSEKFYEWRDQGTLINHSTFPVASGNENLYTASFRSAPTAALNAWQVDDGSVDPVEFKDPWLFDNPDASFGNTKKNRGSSPEWHAISAMGTNEWHKGVFLNQIVQVGSPYYSLRAPKSYTDPSTGIAWIFQNWSWNASQTDVVTDPAPGQDPNYDQKAVIFKQAGATVTAQYKGHLVASSSVASAGNNQRKVVSNSGAFFACYTSGGSVWFTKNSTGSWSNEFRITSSTTAKNPSIAVTANPPQLNVHIVWEEYNGTSNEVFYRRSTDAGSTWQATIAIGTGMNGLHCQGSDAAPVVVGSGSPVVMAWRAFDDRWGGGVFLQADPSDNAEAYFIEGSEDVSSGPSLAYGNGYEFTKPFQIAFVTNGSAIYHAEFGITAYVPSPSTLFLVATGNGLANASIAATTITDNKSLLITWDGLNAGNRRVYARERTTAGNSWNAAFEFSHGTHQCAAPVACYDQNDLKLILLWQCDTHVAKVARGITGTTWTGVIDRGTGTGPAIVARRDGTQPVLAGWMSGTSAPYGLNLNNLAGFQHPTPAQLQSYSPTATIGNGQRKLARGASGMLYQVFESEGDIYFSKSTDNGSTWSSPGYVSKGLVPSEYPSIAERGGELYVVWQTKIGSQYGVYFSRSADQGVTWPSTPITLATPMSCPSPGPVPVVAATKSSASFATLAVYRASTGLQSKYTTANPPVTFSSFAVNGTSANSKNPSLLYHPNSYPPFRLAWDENGAVKYESFYGSSWSGILTFNPSYSQNSSPSIAITGDNSIHLAFQGGGGGYNPWIYLNKNLNTTLYTSIGVGSNYFQPSITGHAAAKASVLWYDASNNVWKSVYSGSSWGAQSNVASGGKYVSVSTTNPPGAVAYAVWTGATGVPYSVAFGPSGGPLQKAAEEEAVTSFVHSRSVQIATNDGAERLVFEMRKPVISLSTGEKFRVPLAPIDDSVFYTAENISDILRTINITGLSGSVRVEAATVIAATVVAERQGVLSDVALSLSVRNATSGGLVASHPVEYDFSQNDVATELLASSDVTLSKDGTFDIVLAPGLEGLQQSSKTDSLLVTIVEHYVLESRSLEGISEPIREYRPLETITAPEAFSLDAYPNPFNPTTRISYSLPSSGHVSIAVYDLLGREIARLVDQESLAGRFTTNFGNGGIATGVYVVRMAFSGEDGRNEVMSRKLMVAK